MHTYNINSEQLESNYIVKTIKLFNRKTILQHRSIDNTSIESNYTVKTIKLFNRKTILKRI